MRSTLLGLLLLPIQIILLLPQRTLAEPAHATNSQIIIYSCQQSLSLYHFACDQQSYWSCACSYQPLFGSILSCIDAYFPNQDKDEAWENVIQSCAKFGNVSLSSSQIQSSLVNASEYLLDHSMISDPNITSYVPILPRREDVTSRFKDYWVFLGNLDIGQHDGFIINYYFFVVLALCGGFYHMKKLSIIRKFNSHYINITRKYISLPILLRSHSQPLHLYKSFTALLPSALESLILLCYITINTVFIFSGYETYPNNHIFGTNTHRQYLRYVADRSGIISFAHLPLLVVFAGRNNILIRLTGINYSSFMIYHKYTARVMLFDAIVHTVAYSILILKDGLLGYYMTKEWFFEGLLAMIFGLVILVLSAHFIRKRWYETFLVSHVILAFVFFIGCYKHCVEFGWLEWVYGASLLWGIDRIIRVCRLYRFGAPLANIENISDQTFKISVLRPDNWLPFPGCFVYVYFWHPLLFWQSHPFTIVDSVLQDQEVVIYIKAKDGLTKRVMDIIGLAEPCQMRISLEGPYGIQYPLDNYDNAILIAGGNGIPGPYYHALELAKKAILIPKNNIRLIWVIRNIDSLKWFESELEILERFYERIEVEIYITARDFSLDQIKTDPALMKFESFVKFFEGRLNIEKFITEELTTNRQTANMGTRGSVGIVTCGPPVLCDQVRECVSQNVDLCPYRVDLFEELQVW